MCKSDFEYSMLLVHFGLGLPCCLCIVLSVISINMSQTKHSMIDFNVQIT